MAQLKDAKARLAGVQTRLAELQKGFDDAVAKKQVRTAFGVSKSMTPTCTKKNIRRIYYRYPKPEKIKIKE